MYYANLNHNKKGITLNLKTDKGKSILKKLACKADVLLENYRPGVMDHLGVGYDVLHEINPRLIYAELSGFGSYGPYRQRPGYDIISQGMGGLMSIYGVIRHNDVFSKAACVSPGIFYNIGRLRGDLDKADINSDTRIYMSWGEIEAGKAPHNGNPEYDTREARSVRSFERDLQARGASTYLSFQREGRHCEADWEKQIPVFMQYLWF